jgi:UDP-2,4-diacetamido-2,4,6-trideoxy-beta-L-altropyranose hydrolase
MALIVIRADASVSTGTGHVMRCLTLADAARDRRATVVFVCRAQPGDLCDLIEARGFKIKRIAGDDDAAAWKEDAEQTTLAIQSLEAIPDWLVVDHYALDHRWESALRGAVGRIMVIDDLANRSHDCDLILDQNYGDNLASRYEELVPRQCVRAVGPRFALLRREFRQARRALRPRDGRLERLLVAFGGSDPTNESGKALAALAQPAFRDLDIEVVTGGLNPHKNELLARHGGDPRISFHENATDLAALMSDADLSIGAGGTMNLERCYLGLPAVVVVTAKNQSETSSALDAAGAIVNLGWHADVAPEQIAMTVAALGRDPANLRSLSRRSTELMQTGASTPDRVDILTTLTGHGT